MARSPPPLRAAATTVRNGRMVLTGKALGICMGTPYFCAQRAVSCPICRRTWSGGRDCPRCGEGHPLIDVAEPSGRKVFLRDKELASAIRGYYGARTGMLVAFWGILLGLVLAVALARTAMVAPAGQAAAWWIAAAICGIVPVGVAVLAGDR